ncbi:hypothetical protein NMG60_11023576 [Bertholletia excelsa]
MRIRNSYPMNSVSAASTSSSSSSSLHSWITIYSIASSTDSSSSSSPWKSSSPCSTRCEGLDLLVKAIHHVCAGSVVGVPYIQRRVIRRRRRAQRFSKLVVTNNNQILKENEGREKPNSTVKRQRRVMALPSKYQDCYVQP